MKYSIIVFLLLLINIHGAFGQQDESKSKPVEFYFNSGVSIPRSHENFAEFYNKSINMGLGLGYELSPLYLMGFEIGYNKFILDGDDFINSFENLKGTATEGDQTTYTFTVSNKIRLKKPEERLRPYIKVNFGLMHQKFDEISLKIFRPDTTFTPVIFVPDTSYVLENTFDTSIILHFGVGIDIRIAEGFYLFAEAKITYAFTKDRHQYIPLKAGILFRR